MTGIIAAPYARAYINFSRWVVDCPTECGGAIALDHGQTLFRCTECLTVSPVEWPGNAQEIWDALMERPVPRTRNWFPTGHTLALRAGCPHGQSVAELREETAEHVGV